MIGWAAELNKQVELSLLVVKLALMRSQERWIK
ncbi:hypothetical protein C3B79_pla131 (plasmid) [Aeromonas hydrophila]|nr:hypothetical protein C3B79_pla131 [Aeromonas hydrophila]